MSPMNTPIRLYRHDSLFINQEYQAFLNALNLEGFDALYRYAGGEVVKDIRERSVTRIDLEINGDRRRFYLKRHRPESLGIKGLLLRFFSGRSISHGRAEFETLCRFRDKGLPTVVPVAAGERLRGPFHAESFVITEDFSPFVSLEEIVLGQPGFLKGPEGQRRKAVLLEEVARLARHMHQSGFNHRDFNATHILLRYENGADTPELALFDLQRVDRNRLFSFRWPIKALAELNYTLPEDLFSAQDRLNLFRAYKGKTRLNIWDRFQWFWIGRKTARIRHHTKNIMARRAERRKKGLPER